MSFVRAMIRASGGSANCDEVKAGYGWLGNPEIVTNAVDDNVTITVEAIQKGIWQRTTLTGNKTDTLPTGALILAALPFMEDGDCYPFMISNTDASHKVTLTTAASGTTVSGNVDVLLITARMFLIRRTSSTTVDVIGL